MTIVDSVGWIAFVRGEPLAARYRPHLLQSGSLLCPSIVIYEVCRRIEADAGPNSAARAAAKMLKTRVVALDETLATAAARVSIVHHLSMADAVIYATAQTFQATLVTSDAHFQGLPLVTYYPR